MLRLLSPWKMPGTAPLILTYRSSFLRNIRNFAVWFLAASGFVQLIDNPGEAGERYGPHGEPMPSCASTLTRS